MTTTVRERIPALDTLRGVAVMGILLMNIVAFAMIAPAYMNPRAQGGAEGIDLAVYLGNFVLFDGKMRGLFSFLFGASTLLVIERATAAGESAARVHYARMVWLLVFGLIHLWFVWWGDILAHYALIGMILWFFRNLPVRKLVIFGCLLVLLETLMLGGMAWSVNMLESGVGSGDAADRAKSLAQFSKSFGVPPAEWAAKTTGDHLGSYWHLASVRFANHRFDPIGMIAFVGPETLGYMLFGMAAFRSGMLNGEWPRNRYAKWLAVTFAIGIPAYTAIALYMVSRGFTTAAVATGLMFLATPVRPLMIVGWACLILLLMRPGGALTTRIAAAGRMAFTNYLITSLICTTIFYGFGFGLFGSLTRAEIYIVVFAVWAGMLLWSKPWLEHFRFGPFEWLWRTLARGNVQPMKGGALAT